MTLCANTSHKGNGWLHCCIHLDIPLKWMWINQIEYHKQTSHRHQKKKLQCHFKQMPCNTTENWTWFICMPLKCNDLHACIEPMLIWSAVFLSKQNGTDSNACEIIGNERRTKMCTQKKHHHHHHHQCSRYCAIWTTIRWCFGVLRLSRRDFRFVFQALDWIIPKRSFDRFML